METGRLSDNLHSPGTRRHLRVSPTMIDDFLIDPVMGVRVIFGMKLDACPSAGLKLCW